MSIRGAERSEGIARRAEQAVQRCTAERRKPFGGDLAEGESRSDALAGVRRVPACMAFQTETAECDWPARPITRRGERPCIQKVIMVGATHLARPWEKLAAKADAGTRVRACEITEGHVRVEMRLREEMRGRRIGRGRRAACQVGRTRGIRI